MRMRITGGQVFDLERGFLDRDVCTDGALISQASGGGETLDASGCYVIPGLVDVHFHGCVGEDFSDATPQGLQRIADFEPRRAPRTGTSSTTRTFPCWSASRRRQRAA